VFLLLFFYCLVSSRPSDVESCIQQCDQSGGSRLVIFCGTDNQTHFVGDSNEIGSCYWSECQVTAQYPGQCGCPNFCGSRFSQGFCWNGECVCNYGYAGPDCTSVSCPNSCFSHGTCVTSQSSIDYCECDQHHTGEDCSIKTINLPVLPYGELFNDREYYANDKYKDDHPVFNLSVIANIRLTLKESDLNYLLYPPNAFNQTYVPASFEFNNGVISQQYDIVGLKLKGRHTRTKLKKGWHISFNTFDKSQHFYKLHRFSLKSPFEATFQRNQLYAEFLRTMMVPISRSSFASLWINDIYWGLLWMNEDMDHTFLKSRYKNATGNLYKCGGGAYLDYEGNNPQVYQNLTYMNYNTPTNLYEQISGNGNWSDFVQLVQVLNISNDKQFEKEIDKIFSVERYLRVLAIEVATMNSDSYSSDGNNWIIYNNPHSGKFEFLSYDLDSSLENVDQMNQSIWEWPSESALLSRRILAIPKWKKLFIDNLKIFLENAFNPSGPVQERLTTLHQTLLPAAERDYFMNLMWSWTIENDYYGDYEELLWPFFNGRYENVKQELKNPK